MSGDFAFRLGPYAFIVVAFILSLFVTWLGFVIGKRIGPPKNETHAAALNTSLASVFVIVGLILSFSFSFAVNRYEQRWQLVVQEADAIRSADLQADELSPADRALMRSYMQRYVATKIDYYSKESEAAEQAGDARLLQRLGHAMWHVAASELSARKAVGLMLLAQSVNTMLEVGADQRAAFDFRLRGPALALIVIVSLVASFLIGLGFGQSGASHWLISTLFCLLVVSLMYVIIDLDSPRAGLITVNLTPLLEVQQELQSGQNGG